MTTYLTIGLSRIQQHLARSRHLWGRRGASEELVLLTMTPGGAEQHQFTGDYLLASLDGKVVELNNDALDIDGLISLKTVADATEEQGLAEARRIARAIHNRLPALPCRVSWVTTDDDYADVITEVRKGDWQHEDYLAAPNEFPLLRLCEECHISPATHDALRVDKHLRLCDDCFTRLGEDGRGRIQARQAPFPPRFSAEGWLRAELEHGGRKLTPVDDFGDLGELVRNRDEQNAADGENQRRVRTHVDNHTALIFGDGNGVGNLFTQLREAKNLDGARELSGTLKTATASSLVAASRGILDDTDPKLPVIPHIVGGDDLLVSLPADRAWPFLLTFLRTLKQALEEMSADPHPSLSAGMVICKAEYPFGNQVELAEELLHRAKASVGGKGWSLAFTDVTYDGIDAEAHQVWTLQRLTERERAIGFVTTGLTSNAEHQITAILRQQDPRVIGQQLAQASARMPDVNSFLNLTGSNPKTLTIHDVKDMKDMLTIARWWR